jgi:hypothetical protein
VLLKDQAAPAIRNLLQSDEMQLYEQLGIRAKAIIEEPMKCGLFEPEVTYDATMMGLKEDMQVLGQKLFRRWHVEAHKLICGPDSASSEDLSDFMGAFGINDVSVGATLSALLVSQLGLTPALAAVVAAILVKRFFRPTFEEFCKAWKKILPEMAL